jgi:hypothetical protein
VGKSVLKHRINNQNKRTQETESRGVLRQNRAECIGGEARARASREDTLRLGGDGGRDLAVRWSRDKCLVGSREARRLRGIMTGEGIAKSNTKELEL